MDEFLSIERAAEILGVDYRTVYRLVRSGELPAGRVGRVYRISREDLQAYFDRGRRSVAEQTRRGLVPLENLRCCVNGKRIVSELDIGGYAWDTGEPISRAAWDAGHRASPGSDERGS